jgi:hypothetical protein
MYRHDLRYFFGFYSVSFAELCEFTVWFMPHAARFFAFLALAVTDDARCSPSMLRISSRPIVSSQFLSDLFSIFIALRN